MKKSLSLFFVSLIVLALMSCGKKEITTDVQAQEALVAAYEQVNAKNGGFMDATFDLAATIEGMPMVFDGRLALGYTVKPDFSAEMDMTINTEMMGMDMSFPFKGYYEVAGEEVVAYFNAMNTWMKTSAPYSQVDIAAMNEFSSMMIKTLSEVSLKGKTEIQDTPVYELEITLVDNAFSQLMEVASTSISESDRQQMEQMLATSEFSLEELDTLFADLTFPIYLRQSDLSLYGVTVDLGQCLNQLIHNVSQMEESELSPEVLSNLGVSGSMLLVYREGEPAGVYTVPQEARDEAIDMNATEELVF